jgi:hypothetical protein
VSYNIYKNNFLLVILKIFLTKMANRQYGFWRMDKNPQPGFSRELISADFEKIKNTTTMDELEVLPFEGVDTLLKAF